MSAAKQPAIPCETGSAVARTDIQVLGSVHYATLRGPSDDDQMRSCGPQAVLQTASVNEIAEPQERDEEGVRSPIPTLGLCRGVARCREGAGDRSARDTLRTTFEEKATDPERSAAVHRAARGEGITPCADSENEVARASRQKWRRYLDMGVSIRRYPAPRTDPQGPDAGGSMPTGCRGKL